MEDLPLNEIDSIEEETLVDKLVFTHENCAQR